MMGDHQAGGAGLAQQRQRLLLHGLAQLHVEAGERLVHQHHGRTRHERAGERHALLLAAREHVRMGVAVAFEADAGQHGQGLALGQSGVETLQAEHHVLEDGQVRKEREVLEHQADVALLGRNEPSLVLGNFRNY